MLVEIEDTPAHRAGASYEIRTHISRHRTSLILIAVCANDIAAIVMAQDFIRKNEGGEVWREDTLVYRLEPRMARNGQRQIRRKQLSVPILKSRRWFQYLTNAWAIGSPNNWLSP